MKQVTQSSDSVTPLRPEDLQFVVQCQSTQAFFENIAAFNCRQAADGYAAECAGANPGYSYRVTHAFPPIPHASVIEKQIVGRLVADLLAAGYAISVNDGEEQVLNQSIRAEEIWPVLSSTDTDTLNVAAEGKKSSFVFLVWGNDCDVISDYGVSLENVLVDANKLAEALQ